MAVFTLLDEMHIEEVVDAYACGQLLDFWGIAAGSENTNYMCETTTGNYILTLFEARGNPENIVPQMVFVNKLHAAGLPAPKMLLQPNGEPLYDLLGKKAALQTCLTGAAIKMPSAAQSYQAGAVLAKIHQVGEAQPVGIKNALAMNELVAIAEEIQVEHASTELSEVIRFLESYQIPQGLPSGGIHGDYFRDNVFFKGDEVSGVFDFWFACDDLLVHDLAISLNVWGFESGGIYREELFNSFLEGYTSVRALSAEEQAVLPQELQRATVRFYLTRLYDQLMTDKNLTDKPPETWYRRFAFFKSWGNK